MTIEEFRRHPWLAPQWRRELETNGILHAVLEVMEENHPAHFAINGDRQEDVSPTRAAIELGLTRGYSKFGELLKKLAQPLPPTHQTPEPTYEKPPQIQTQQVT